MKLRSCTKSFKRYVRFHRGIKRNIIQLKSTPDSWLKVHYERDPILEEIFKNGIEISDQRVQHLVKELDRRFSQLWHKVSHERNKN